MLITFSAVEGKSPENAWKKVTFSRAFYAFSMSVFGSHLNQGEGSHSDDFSGDRKHAYGWQVEGPAVRVTDTHMLYVLQEQLLPLFLPIEVGSVRLLYKATDFPACV